MSPIDYAYVNRGRGVEPRATQTTELWAWDLNLSLPSVRVLLLLSWLQSSLTIQVKGFSHKVQLVVVKPEELRVLGLLECSVKAI